MPFDWLNIVGVILTLGFVLFLAYFSVRLMGRAKVGRSKNVKVIEAVALSPQNTLQLVQAGDKFFLVGVSRTGITMIGEVNAESVSIGEMLTEMPFEKFFANVLSRKKKEDDGDKIE
jgi:flagellar biosynthetic protein FliO